LSRIVHPAGWICKPFSKAAARIQTRGGKLKTKEYQESGCFPIVDQGQNFVVAYTGKRDCLFQGPYPVIVFGDHTKNVKLVDFEFAVGADGVVLLRPADENELDIRFLYYWLKYVPLHDLGYSRHFKLLKEQNITYPVNLNEQRRIVARIEKLTSRAEKARTLAQERETELDTLLRSTYSRMIEDVKWKPLKEVAFLIRRGVKTKPEAEYEEMGVRSFGKGTFKKPVLTGEQIGKKRIYWIHKDDLVFNNVFAWEKAIAVAQEEDHRRVGSHRFITYVPNEKQITSEFMCHHFLSEKGIDDIRAASPGSAGRNRTLGLKKLEKILVPVPDYDEQLRFAEMAKRRLEIQKETAKVDTELKVYSAAVIAKAFRWEL